MGRRHASALQRALAANATRFPASEAWRDLVARFECGRIVGRFVELTAADRQRLRQLAQAQWGFDPLLGPPDGTRLDVSATARDDKISRQRPLAGHVLAKGSCLGVALPEGWSARLPVAAVDWRTVGAVVVVENPDCFDAWTPGPSLGLPNPLILYRGHDGIATAVKALLSSAPADRPVAVFPDFDPAGLEIALTTPAATHLIAPAIIDDVQAFHDHRDYAAQVAATAYLDGLAQNPLQGLWSAMRQKQISCKQQHLIARRIPLRLYPLKRAD